MRPRTNRLSGACGAVFVPAVVCLLLAASLSACGTDAATATDAATETPASIAAQQATLLAAPFAVIAHRGGRKLWPEHTTVAYDGAVALGVDLIEFDVHRTKDGVLVVLHDASVDRTTDGEGAVRAMTYAELSALDAGFHFTTDGGKTFPHRGTGLTIPRLDAMLDRYPTTPFSLEIKQYDPPIVEDVVALLEAKGAIGRSIVSAFADATIQAVRARRPDLLTALGLGESLGILSMSDAELAAWTPPAVFVQPDEKMVDAALVARCHGKGLKIQAWTVNDPVRMQALIALGVDGLFTDDPKALLGLDRP